MRLWILGCRGIPAQHGGFETFAEQLAHYMVSQRHEVIVACQVGPGEPEGEDMWHGIRRVKFSEKNEPKGTIKFDLRSALAASRDKGAVVLTLGYNTAIFSLIHRARGVRHLMNMDGVEWRRQKWTPLQRVWLRINEWLGATYANELIADHPAIKEHLANIANPGKITVIPYGADAVQSAPTDPITSMGLSPGAYDLIIARPEPENSILEIVKAYTLGERRYPLVILGRYVPEENEYHKQVLEAARGSNILFAGAIYDSSCVSALRFHARTYIHGHQVGGTNPSLVEALAAGNAVICHRNSYNTWVAGDMAQYFSTPEELRDLFDEFDRHPERLDDMRVASRRRHQQCFRSEMIMEAYEHLLSNVPVRVAEWSNSHPARHVVLSAPGNRI